MVVPRWVTKTQCQPISIGDVLELLHVLGNEQSLNEVLEIGGPEVASYREMMDAYTKVGWAAEKSHPSRSSFNSKAFFLLGESCESPLPFTLARALIDSLTTDVIVKESSSRFLSQGPKDGLENAIGKAVTRVKELEIPTRWSDTGGYKDPASPVPSDPEWSGGKILVDRRSMKSSVSPEKLMATIKSVGGENGWFAFNGFGLFVALPTKSLVVSVFDAERHPTDLRVGDTVDFFQSDHVNHQPFTTSGGNESYWRHAWLEWRVEETPGKVMK